MRFIGLVIITLVFKVQILACGGGDYGEYYDFYPVFNQELIGSEEYSPFLFSRDQMYYDGDDEYRDVMDKQKGNFDLWLKHFPQYELEDLDDLFFNQGFESNFKKKYNSEIDLAVLEYVNYARSIEKRYISPNRWSYKNHLNGRDAVDYSEFVKIGIEKYNKVKNKALKQRYAYQIIKGLRYNKDYNGLLHFYEKEKLNNLQKNEMYYYTLDQLGGCLYQLKQYDKAISIFTKVFTHSVDRKKSAHLSYQFCLQYTQTKLDLKNKSEMMSFYLLKNRSSFNDGFEILKEMKALDKNDGRLEVVFARMMSYFDREYWSSHRDYTKEFDDKNRPGWLNKLKSFASEMKSSKNKDYWNYCYFYLLGLEKQYDKAILGLSKIRNPKFKRDIADLTVLFKVKGWKTTNDIDQKYFLSWNTINKEERYDESYSGSRHVIKNHLEKLFVAEGKFAQAYLMNNTLGEGRFSEHQLINQLHEFIDKPKKTNFEKFLVKNLGPTPKIDLQYDQALLYLIEGDFDLAIKTFPDVQMDHYIPKTIFSNTLKTCFECSAESMMTDSVYLASIFDFIPDVMNQKVLAKVLIDLKEMAAKELNWKGQLANYLLGNYYNNISNTGYFRGILWYDVNCCDYGYVTHANTNMELKDYILSYNQNPKVYFDFATQATVFYNQVIGSSNNKELKARTTFLLAQCELNNLDNESSSILSYKYDSNSYQYNFDKNNVLDEIYNNLNTTYKDTKFHAQIIKECSYFKAYCL